MGLLCLGLSGIDGNVSEVVGQQDYDTSVCIQTSLISPDQGKDGHLKGRWLSLQRWVTLACRRNLSQLTLLAMKKQGLCPAATEAQ